MRFLYGKQDMRSLLRAQEQCYLMTNGLGGYSSLTAAFSAPRADQGLLVAAVKAPNERVTMVHRMREQLCIGEKRVFLSSQAFADGAFCEEGYRFISSFAFDGTPAWRYSVDGVEVERRCALGYGKNAAAVLYVVDNRSGEDCVLTLEPMLKFAAKETAVEEEKTFTLTGGQISDGAYTLFLRTDGTLIKMPERREVLSYSEDAKDGRPEKGLAFSCCAVRKTVAAGERATVEIVFSMTDEALSGWEMLRAQRERLAGLEKACGFVDPVAAQLSLSADAFIAHRHSTNGKTILAGYPLFSDWGRDTMIALAGCTLSTGRFEDAKSILRTFLAYEKDGLVPNLFPEGEAKPMYNTVDAALLLIDCVWQYHQRTGDTDFVKEALPVLERIIAAYQKGTHHAISMDTDALIRSGEGFDQVTWMDVCVNGILPTPRHGKCVEINAYWYNALCIMERFSALLGKDGTAYGELAQRVKESFIKAFYMEEKGCLKDVISGTKADEQIRCNQIWAVSMPFTMLSDEQECGVVDTVFRHLYTPCGLRTLSSADPEYHGVYGGAQVERDMAYHQGTVWVFPMGAYYLAYLKTNGHSKEAAACVREQLMALEPMLREGCAGQLPEIYSGDHPAESKGCFAQAWSVGEMLRVFEAVERIEQQVGQ